MSQLAGTAFWLDRTKKPQFAQQIALTVSEVRAAQAELCRHRRAVYESNQLQNGLPLIAEGLYVPPFTSDK
jgi:hypothetical protein